MNIAVIGTGWLGHPLASSLNASGHIVYGSRRSASSGENVDYRPFIYPSANPVNKEILQKADVVVLAFPPDRSSSEAYAKDCLEVCLHISGQCHVVLTSSTSVYPAIGGTCEETRLADLTFSEHAIARAEYELAQKVGDRLTIVRLAGLIGPGRYPVKNMSKSGKVYKGNDPVNVIHQTDAVKLLAFVIENNIQGEIINGSAGEHPTRENYYSWMAPQVGVEPPVFETVNGEGKIISSEKSRNLGFSYSYDNPFDFLN
jgi:nucleoside-diphosphate-sugar epimerase